ncbi:hypothetical protein [Nocardioides sp. AE5]|uniref:hypothetical protein n=1 Tax=Nocardioides sp. AE5 TaxID=2962573 RepID=UPI00288289CA|nr:hypothetical protein [Nocardioides sp. AE5]MDT0202143.1 hypothetical protein [Nocardioides sp. AE5]
MRSKIVVSHGFWAWGAGIGLVGLAAMIGPRVVYRLADGTEVAHPALVPGQGPQWMPMVVMYSCSVMEPR